MRGKLPIFYNALILTAVNLLLRLVSTSFQVYLSGRIGPAGIGLLQLVLSVGMLAMTAAMAGARTASMYLTAEELGRKKPQNIPWILSGCFAYSIIISCGVCVALNLFAPVIAGYWIGNIQTASSIRLYSAFLPIQCLCGVMVGYFTAANKISTLAVVEIAEQLFSMAVTMLALNFWAGHDPVRSCQAVIVGSGVSGCLTLLSLIVLRLCAKEKCGPRIPVRQRLLQTAVPLALADDLRSGISTAENLMVPKRLALYSGISDPLAAFGTVCGMVFPVLMFPAAILFGLAELLIPELARCNAAASRTRIEYLVRRSLRVALLYGCLFCGLMFLLAKPICLRLYNSQDAGTFLQYYALLIPMLYCDAITDAMTKGLGQQKACVRYNIITSSMDVALLFLLLPHWGMTGYFISFFVTHLLNFILSLRRLLMIVKLRIRITVPFLCLGATGCSIAICSLLDAPALQAAAYVLIFCCLLFLLKVMGKEDLHWIKGLCKPK